MNEPITFRLETFGAITVILVIFIAGVFAGHYWWPT